MHSAALVGVGKDNVPSNVPSTMSYSCTRKNHLLKFKKQEMLLYQEYFYLKIIFLFQQNVFLFPQEYFSSIYKTMSLK